MIEHYKVRQVVLSRCSQNGCRCNQIGGNAKTPAFAGVKNNYLLAIKGAC